MEFRKVLALRGPNIWANFPVLEAWVDLGDLDKPSTEFPGFNDRLMRWMPTMIEHRCSIGERGGFFQRLRTGTYLGPYPRTRHAGAADVGGHGGRFRQGPRNLRSRASTKSSSSMSRRRWAASAWPSPASCAWRPSTIGPSTSPRKSSGSRDLAQEVCLGPSTRAIVEAAQARGHPLPPAEYREPGAVRSRAETAPHSGGRDGPHQRHRRGDCPRQGNDPHVAPRRGRADALRPAGEGRRGRLGRRPARSACRWSSSRRTATRAAAWPPTLPRREQVVARPTRRRGRKASRCWSRSSPRATTIGCWSSAIGWWPPPAASRPRCSATASIPWPNWSSQANADPRRGEHHATVLSKIKLDAIAAGRAGRSRAHAPTRFRRPAPSC